MKIKHIKIQRYFILIIILIVLLFSSKINVQTVSLSNPANNSIDMLYNVILKWFKLQNATSYAVEYSVNSDMTGETSLGGLSDTIFNLNNLPASSTWYWRILGITGGTNEWSEIWHFSTMDVGIPVQASPENNSVDIPYISTKL